MTPEEKNSALFASLVMMFQSAAMQNLGKIKSPVTDKLERDLEQAQLTIDILDMLLVKAKGNMSPDEERFLKGVVQELKLNYVDEKAKDEPKPAEKGGTP